MNKEHILEKAQQIQAFVFNNTTTQAQWAKWAESYLIYCNELREKYPTAKQQETGLLEALLISMVEDYFNVVDMVADMESFRDVAYAERLKYHATINPKATLTYVKELAQADIQVVTFLYALANNTLKVLMEAKSNYQSVLRVMNHI